MGGGGWAWVLAAPFFLGFLLLPWAARREDLPVTADGRAERLAAGAVVAGFYGVVLASGTADALWAVWALPTAAANRLLPVLWAVFGLPAWALALIVWPDAACRLLQHLGVAGTWRARECRLLGWLLLAAAALAAGAAAIALGAWI